jgi:phage gp36-like protein
MYAVEQDMIDRFGLEELIQTTDKAETQTNAVVTARINAAIADAEAELNLILSCCYDLRTIKAVYDAGNEIEILKHWTCYITRKHLYTDFENGENQVTRDYKDYEEEIKKTCECSDLYDDEFNLVPKKGFSVYYEDPGCYPAKQCCCEGTCGCKGASWSE